MATSDLKSIKLRMVFDMRGHCSVTRQSIRHGSRNYDCIENAPLSYDRNQE
ncbi:hypothetical protein ACQUWN_09425 [Rossellomorea aquimaris]|uniref:hypothetical protein n=1 Tax=Rossellomorea TaxID=2837508 RepID=UPI0016535C52|nr:hypothetical protein [Rossellomorea vietnamensis]